MNDSKTAPRQTRRYQNWLQHVIFLLRKKFTARQFRYLFGAYVLAPIPWLRHRYSAYARSATLPEFESNVVAQEEVRATLDLSDMGEDYLTWYRSTPDLPAMHDNRIELRLDFMAKVLDDCELLPRSPAILHRPSERIVLCPGRKAERNIVRPVRYRATEHVSGLSISMAGVHHYYHFSSTRCCWSCKPSMPYRRQGKQRSWPTSACCPSKRPLTTSFVSNSPCCISTRLLRM